MPMLQNRAKILIMLISFGSARSTMKVVGHDITANKNTFDTTRNNLDEQCMKINTLLRHNQKNIDKQCMKWNRLCHIQKEYR